MKESATGFEKWFPLGEGTWGKGLRIAIYLILPTVTKLNQNLKKKIFEKKAILLSEQLYSTFLEMFRSRLMRLFILFIL